MEYTVVIMFDEGTGLWAVRGIEYDICAQGDSPRKAMENFAATVYCEYLLAEHLGKSLRECVPEAPKDVWDMCEKNSSNSFRPYSVENIGATTLENPFTLKPYLAV